MIRFLVFLFLILFTSTTFSQSLSADDKWYIKKYVLQDQKIPDDALATFLDDPAHVNRLRECVKLSHDLEHLINVKGYTSLYQMVDEFTKKYADKRSVFFPGWKEEEHGYLMQISFVSNDMYGDKYILGVNEANHHRLLQEYIKERSAGLTSDNAFGSVAVRFPESVDELKTGMKKSEAATNALAQDQVYSLARENETVTSDSRLTLWLEINFYRNMRREAIKKIDAELIGPLEARLESCKDYITGDVEEKLPKHTVSIRVVDEKKNGVSFATINFPDGSVQTTDQFGKYNYVHTGLQKPVRIEVSKDGYETTVWSIAPGMTAIVVDLSKKKQVTSKSRWDGTYANDTMTLKLTGNSATYSYRSKGYTQTGTWTIKWDNEYGAKGTFSEKYEDAEKYGTRGGAVVIVMEENKLTYETVNYAPSFKWKDGIQRPSPWIEGMTWNQVLIRKN